jgi:hypothetical protein
MDFFGAALIVTAASIIFGIVLINQAYKHPL